MQTEHIKDRVTQSGGTWTLSVLQQQHTPIFELLLETSVN